MRDLIFAFMLGTGEGEKDALRLARSIRTFGGEYCFNPIWMFSQRAEEELTAETRQELFSAGARLISFEMEANGTDFFMQNYVTAAAFAEGLGQGETSFLAFMATDTLVLKPPRAFLLPAGKSLGGCPVHLKLLGSGIGEEVDEFWGLVYKHCGVDAEQVFAMQTIADEQMVRAYINSGLLVVRPERGFLRAWKANFDSLYRQPEAEDLYRQHQLYEIFMHQVVLAGTLVSRLKPEEFQQLPFTVNYPLHLHSKVRAGSRPNGLYELTTCRYEEYGETFSTPEVKRLLEEDASLRAWVEAQ
jgi:hypothetical protein